jgi:hypothetical protein
MQCTFAKRFQHYDYGRFGNLKVYGQTSPPLYELANVTIPVATFHSDGDQLCTPTVMNSLFYIIPNDQGSAEDFRIFIDFVFRM